MTEADHDPSAITRLLRQMRDEGGDASAELFPSVYDELRRRARAVLSDERQDHTLTPTALVHEAYLKLTAGSNVDWQDEAHFLAVAARAMRQVLVDHARTRGRIKRGGGRLRVTLDEGLAAVRDTEADLLALEDALERLMALDLRKGRVAELRLFGGMGVREVAQVLQVGTRTVEADWAMARAWLETELR